MPPTYEFQIPSHARKSFEGCRGRGCVYARVSGASDPKVGSLETQAQAQVDALVAAGFFLEPADVKFERCSGVNSLAFRKELMQLRDLVEEGYYRAFAVHDPDRLVRGMEVVGVVYDMEAAGCEVWLNGKLSEPSDERDLLLAVGGFASKKEAKQIMERTSRVRRRLQEAGEWVGAAPPLYGLAFEKKTRTRRRHPEQAPIVLRIFEMTAANQSHSRVARALNAEGIAPPGASRRGARNGLWSPVAVNRIVREPTYMGKSFVNRVRYLRDDRGRVVRRNGRKARIPVPREEWIEVAVAKTEAIVPEELWLVANARVDDAKLRSSRADAARQEARPYLLRGYLHCAECGRRMRPSFRTMRGKRYDIYECSTTRTEFFPGRAQAVPARGRSVVKHKIEAMAVQVLDALIADPAFIDRSIELAFAEDDGEARLRRERERAESALARLDKQVAAFVGDLNDPDLGDRARKAIRAQLGMVEAQIAETERTRSDLAAQLATLADRGRVMVLYRERCEEIRRRLRERRGDAGSMAYYRDFMEGFGVKFSFFQGHLEVECRPGVELPATYSIPLRSSSSPLWNVKNDLPPLRLDLTPLGLAV